MLEFVPTCKYLIHEFVALHPIPEFERGYFFISSAICLVEHFLLVNLGLKYYYFLCHFMYIVI